MRACACVGVCGANVCVVPSAMLVGARAVWHVSERACECAFVCACFCVLSCVCGVCDVCVLVLVCAGGGAHM